MKSPISPLRGEINILLYELTDSDDVVKELGDKIEQAINNQDTLEGMLESLPKFINTDRGMLYLTIEWLGDEKWSANYQLDADRIEHECRASSLKAAVEALIARLQEEKII